MRRVLPLEQNINQNIDQNIDQNIEQNIDQNIDENIDQNIEQNIDQNIEQNIDQNIDQSNTQITCFDKFKNKCCTRGILHKIIKRHTSLNRFDSLFWSYMTVIVGVYLSCEALQLSPLIAKSDHYSPTVYAYVYNLLYVWLTTFFLLKQQNITQNNIPDSLFYWTMAHIGGLGFAMLGEVPFLRNLVIVNNFWKDLTLNAWITIIIIASIIIYIGIFEAVDSCAEGKFKKNLINILLIAVSYTYILVLLHVNEAKYIHFHVHHAIFAGLLSSWFTTWKSWLEMGMHAILMGVVVEGIDFYGIGELSLFMVKGTTMMTFPAAISAASIYGAIVIFLYSISYCE